MKVSFPRRDVPVHQQCKWIAAFSKWKLNCVNTHQLPLGLDSEHAHLLRPCTLPTQGRKERLLRVRKAALTSRPQAGRLKCRSRKSTCLRWANCYTSSHPQSLPAQGCPWSQAYLVTPTSMEASAQNSMQREEWGGGYRLRSPQRTLQTGHRGQPRIIKNICYYSYPILTKWFLSRECLQVKSSFS